MAMPAVYNPVRSERLARISGRWAFVGILFFSGGISPLRAGDDFGKAAPSAAHQVPVRLGAVDAVRGNLSVSMPLGPVMPGRLPVGLSWHFESHDPKQFRAGGRFQAATWPVSLGMTALYYTAPTTQVQVGTKTYTFYRNASPAGGLLSDSALQSLMSARGVDNGASEVGDGVGEFHVAYKQPSSDGTQWYVETNWTVYKEVKPGTFGWITAGLRQVVLDGPNAIWTDGHSTHFTSRWGDHIVAEDTRDSQGTTTGIRLTNLRDPNSWVNIAVNLAVPKAAVGQGKFLVYQSPSLTNPGNLATMTVTNGLGLPKVVVSGIYRENSEYVGQAWGPPGFLPLTWTYDADGEPLVTSFNWEKYGEESVPDPLETGSDTLVLSPEARLTSVNHPNGLVETFRYGVSANLASKAFNADGIWQGYKIAVPNSQGVSAEVPNPGPGLAVTQVMNTGDGGDGRLVVIQRNLPKINKAGGSASYTWAEQTHETWILNYPTATPSSATTYRGFHLVHPSANSFAGAPSSQNAFLFATSAIVASERIHGQSGAPDPNNFVSWAPSNVVRDQVTVFDGWDLRSWGNPSGAISSSLASAAVATRTTANAPNLPTKVTVVGLVRDAWGPTKTLEAILPPDGLPSIDGNSVGAWAGSLGAPSGTVLRSATITRSWNAAALVLVTDHEEKTLQVQGLAPLHNAASASFGVNDMLHDGSNGLLLESKLSRNGSEIVDTWSYWPGTPLPAQVSRTVKQGGESLLFSGSIGAINTYSGGTFNWLATESDLLTGRGITYANWTPVGQPQSKTDANGIQTLIGYDSRGRVKTETRLAKGAIGSVTTAYEYHSAGLWMKETVYAEGKVLPTRTDYDVYGQIIKVTRPDGRYQITTYDGFGQKVGQTPFLRSGQTGGLAVWTYDGKGQVRSGTNAHGELLFSNSDPQWDASEGGVVTQSIDDRGFIRREVSDLLGNRRVIIDQAGQRSYLMYDLDGHLIQSNQNGQVRSYSYDAGTGWLTGRMEPEEGTTTFTSFTAMGTARVRQQFGSGGTITSTTQLDSWARPCQITVVDGLTTLSRTLAYRNDYNVVTTLSEAQGTEKIYESYGYDDYGRRNEKVVTDVNRAQSFLIKQFIDSLGNVTSLTYPAGGGKSSQTVTTTYPSIHPEVVSVDGSLRGQMFYGAGSGSGCSDTLAYANGTSSTSYWDLDRLNQVDHQVSGAKGNQPLLPGNVQQNYMTWSSGGLLLTRGPDANPESVANDKFEYDALQRLNHSRVMGPTGEQVNQWFRYDFWGNRVQSDYTYSGGTMPLPLELVAWAGSAAAGNRMPGSITALVPGSGKYGDGTSAGAQATGALYDSWGRLIQVSAIPGDPSSFTAWSYDPEGRIVSEMTFGQQVSFLLDGEGLRFRRSRPDGSITYTIYGFDREPLSVFDYLPQRATEAATPYRAQVGSATSAKTLSASKGTVTPAAAGMTPAVAWIIAPANNYVGRVGQSIAFQGDTVDGSVFLWTFGDGTTSTSMTPYKTYSATGTFTVVFKASGVGFSPSTASITLTILPALPIISSFTASPSTVAQGSSSTLAWSVSGATSLSLDNGIGTVTGTTSRTVTPANTLTYVLTATNAGGSITRNVTVNVVGPPTISSFYASPASIYQGDGSTLAWSVIGATDMSLDNGIGTVTGSSSRTVNPSSSTTYILTATNSLNGVSVSRSASSTITVSPRPTVPSINSFTVDANPIAAGTSTTLRWSVSNAVGSVNVTLSGTGSVATNGSLGITPAQSITYTLTATNSLDTTKYVSRDVTVTVVQKPAITINANPGTIYAGSSSTLTWNVANGPTTVSLDQGIGSVAASGSTLVAPPVTRNYTLTATNMAGTSTATVTITVSQKPVISSFAASPSSIIQGNTTTLAWSVFGATSLKLNGAAISGADISVSPGQTTVYTLEATNGAGTASQSCTVIVLAPESFRWTKSLVYGFGVLLSEERAVDTIYVMGDQVGSPNLITDRDGFLVGRSKNLPFGERFWQMGEKSTRRYTNHEDVDGSAIYMQARTYLPAYGRFAQVDPLYDQAGSDPESWNLYSYVTNNPVTHTDPDGRQPTFLIDGATLSQGAWDSSSSLEGSGSYLDPIKRVEKLIATGLQTEDGKDIYIRVITYERVAPKSTSKSEEAGKTFRFGIGIEVPSSSAVSNGVLNASPIGGGDPGHTFEYVRDPSGAIVSLMSFGPAGRIRTAEDFTAFQNGQTPGTAKHPLSGNISTWETSISPSQAKLAIQINSWLKSNPPNYTKNAQCTGIALMVGRLIGVNLPSGIGPVVIRVPDTRFLGLTNKTIWSGNVPNPYHLSRQMTQLYGPPQIRNSGDF